MSTSVRVPRSRPSNRHRTVADACDRPETPSNTPSWTNLDGWMSDHLQQRHGSSAQIYLSSASQHCSILLGKMFNWAWKWGLRLLAGTGGLGAVLLSLVVVFQRKLLYVPVSKRRCTPAEPTPPPAKLNCRISCIRVSAATSSAVSFLPLQPAFSAPNKPRPSNLGILFARAMITLPCGLTCLPGRAGAGEGLLLAAGLLQAGLRGRVA